MKKSEPFSLFTPQRQSIVAILIILIKFVRSMARQFWPILLVIFFNPKGNKDLYFGIFIAALGFVSLAGSVISYFKYYFFIKDGELNVRKGVLRKTSLNVPFERIQSIDFEQNIVHQIFNVVSVKIDTAGSKGSELSIDAIAKDHAYELRDYILQQKAKLKGGRLEDSSQENLDEAKELILELKPPDLMRVGVSQNHLRTAALILLFFFSVAEDFGEAMGFDLINKIEENYGQIFETSLLVGLILVPVFIFISFLITLFRTVIQYFDLKFWKTTHGFKLVSGLLTRKEKSMQNEKIQIVGWSNNPLKKFFGIFRLRIYQAASVDVLGSKSMTIPGAYQHQIDQTILSLIPESDGAVYEHHGVHPLARFRFIWFFGILPLLVITAIAYFTKTPDWYAAWVYFPLAIFMGHQYYRKKGFQMHPDYFIAEGGVFGRNYKMVELFKVQAVKVSQSWYENRKDLSTIHIYTAAGEISIPYLPIIKARKLNDYILYRIEVSRENWM